MLLLLKRIGNKLDITKLASELSVSRETIYTYISFLESTYFIKLISPFTKSKDREISGTKKIYVCDNGIAKYIGDTDEGNLLENAVFNCLRGLGKINYYEKRSGGEIDFIINEKSMALEVKTKGDEMDYLRLKRISEELGLKEHYIITKEFVDKKGFVLASDI